MYRASRRGVGVEGGGGEGVSEGWAYSPAQDTTEEGGVEALRRGEAALHLRYRHLVLGGGGEEGEAAWHGAEHVVAR